MTQAPSRASEKLAVLRQTIEQLRAVVALQRACAHHGLSAAAIRSTDMATLWRSAHSGALLAIGFNGDPAAFVTYYVEEAMREHTKMAGNAQLIRERGCQTVSRLQQAIIAYGRLGGEIPPDGWHVPYFPS